MFLVVLLGHAIQRGLVINYTENIIFIFFCFSYYISIYFDKIKPYIKYITAFAFIVYLILFKCFSNTLISYLIAVSTIIIIYYLVVLIKIGKINQLLVFFEKNL